tara:strand:+ start:47 stop:607 length:561 start_codon:yes stop_codon:yes gene_type:complete
MATKTKTKTKDKLKSSLKNVLLKEMKGKKKEERIERIKENADLQEIIVYTKFSTPLCTQLIDKLKEEGISYIEKPLLDNEEEFNNIALITNQYQFPTIIVNEEYLVPNRDFSQVPQAIEIIKRIGKEGVIIPPVDVRTMEGLKNLGAGINQQFQNLGRQINQLQQKIDPIQKFIDKLKEEIESEDA